MKKLYLIGLWMIWLMINWPIAHAATLSVISIKGQDNIENYYKPNDVITIDVLAGVENEDAVERDQLRVYVDDSTAFSIFDNCMEEAGTDFYLCSLQKTVFGQSGSHDFKIRLYDDFSKLDSNAASLMEDIQTMTVDANPPTITFDIREDETADPTITVDYDVRDTAITGNSQLCSGIALLEFTKDEPGGTVVQSLTGDGSCRMNGDQTLTISEADGEKIICLVATDFLGNTDSSCDTFVLDKSRPSVADIRVIDNNFDDIQFVSPLGTQPVNVEITFDDLSLVQSTVKADFIKFTTLPGYINRMPDSWKDNVTAVWIVPTQGFSSCSVDVFAEDALGNTLTETIQCDAIVDDEGPETQSASTGIITPDGTHLFGQSTNVQVTFKEDGVGMSEEIAYLDLSQVTGDSRKIADQCIQSGTNWICFWNITTNIVKEEDIQFAVHRDTKDDLGNPVAIEGRVFSAVVDTINPIILNSSMEIIGGPFSTGDFAVRGDAIEFTFEVENADQSTSYADFSIFGGDEQTPPTTCTPATDGISTCKFTANVDSPGYYLAQPVFYIRDTAGNTVTETFSVEIYETEDDIQNPDFWQVHVAECSPEPIDRAVTSLINYNVICKVPLTSSTQAARMLFFDLDSGACTGQNNDLDYIVDINAFNTGPGQTPNTKDIYLSIYLDKVEMDKDDLTITCPAYIGTVRDKTVITTPEQDNITVKLQFFNNPFGSPSDEVTAALNSVSQNKAKIGETLAKLEKLMEYIVKICQVKGIISGILAALDVVIAAFMPAIAAAKATGVGEGVAQTLKRAQATICDTNTGVKKGYISPMAKGIFSKIEPFCNFVNCNVASRAKPKEGAKFELGETVKSTLTAGAPWCQDLQRIWKSKLKGTGDAKFGSKSGEALRKSGQSAEPKSQAPKETSEVTWKQANEGWANDLLGSFPADIKESLVWSLACLCLPGIIHNFKKMYEIECKYGLCLMEDVAEQGLPLSLCKAQKHYDECVFIWGQIFNALPLSGINDFIGELVNIFSNIEGAVVAIASGALCDYACELMKTNPNEIGASYIACSVVKTVQKVADAYESSSQILDSDYFDVPDLNYCKDFLKKSKGIEKEIVAD